MKQSSVFVLIIMLLMGGLSAAQAQEGSWVAQYYNNPNLEGGPVLVRAEATPAHNWGAGSPAPEVQADNFSARWVSTQPLPAGVYELYVRADDGVRVYVDGERIIDEWHSATGETYRAQFRANNQPQTFAVEYYDSQSNAFIDYTLVPVEEVTAPDTATNWLAQYYNNPNLEGGPVYVRYEPSPTHNWGDISPAPGVNADNFSVRWTEFSDLEGGRYRLRVLADDGVRVYIDGERIIDEWHPASGQPYEEIVTLDEGRHSFTVEYYDGQSAASLDYSFEPIPDEQEPVSMAQNWIAQYYNNRNLEGGPIVVREENALDYNWGDGSPAASISRDNFSARWTSSQYFEAGEYRIRVVSDDGVRVYVDGEEVIDEWRIVDSGRYSETIRLTSGQHTISVEYFEAEARARIEFSIQRVDGGGGAAPTPLPVNVNEEWLAEYYNNTNLEGIPIVTRREGDLNHYWGTGTPVQSIGRDRFSARWIKQVQLDAGLYTVSVRADDGVRVYVNGELVIDEWHEATAETYTTVVNLPGGNIPFVVEYYEQEFNAYIDYDFAPYSSANTPIINPDFTTFGPWTVEYFNNQELFGSPTAILSDQGPNHDWGSGAPLGVLSRDGFSARWTITEAFEAGTYEISTRVDDGVRVWIDGVQYIDEWHTAQDRTYTARVNLPEGEHAVRVEYFEQQGNAFIEFGLQPVDDTIPPTPSQVNAPDTPRQTQATGTVGIFGLNVRDAPSTTEGDIITRIAPEEEYPIVGRNADSTWWQIRLPDGQTGWVFGRFIVTENTANVPVTYDAGERVSSEYTITANTIVNIRNRPSAEARILGNLRPRDTAQLLARNSNNSWWKINYNGIEGWIISGAATANENVSVFDIPVESN